MLVLHVSIESWVGEVCLIAVVASVVSSLYIVFRPSLLLFLVRIVIITLFITVTVFGTLPILIHLVLNLQSQRGRLHNIGLKHLGCLRHLRHDRLFFGFSFDLDSMWHLYYLREGF